MEVSNHRQTRHAEQVYLSPQGSSHFSWGSKQVGVGHFERALHIGFIRAWSGVFPPGSMALAECDLGYLGHVEQVYLRRQGPGRLSWPSLLGVKTR